MNDDIVKLALKLAKEAFDAGETPVGAVIFHTKTNAILTGAHNEVVLANDPTAHAEVLAIRQAGRVLEKYNLSGYSIYATLEPCAMCACAISWAQLDRLYFGAYDPKSGAVEHGPRIYDCSTCHHKPEVIGGLCEKECQKLMKDFFKGLRENA